MSETEDRNYSRRKGMVSRVVAFFLGGMTRLTRASRIAVHRREPRAMAIRAGVVLAVLLLVLVLFDASAITGARRLPGWVIGAFYEVTDFGKSGWFLWPLAGLILLLAAAPADLPPMAQRVLAAIATRASFLFIAIGLPSLFTTIVKRIIGRARPFVGGGPDAYSFHPFAWQVEYASMPSGHATSAFAAAAAIGMVWPQARLVMWTYAIVIGISRVVVTAHHPTDVLVGALVGVGGALLTRRYFAAKRLAFGLSEYGTVTHFPGPSGRRLKTVARTLLAD